MNIVPLQEENLVEQQDRIIILGVLPQGFGADSALRWATLRHLLLALKLTELLALVCLGVATDGGVYLVGRRVAVRLEAREDRLLPMHGCPRTLLALSRLLSRWMSCREIVVAAPVVPGDAATAGKQGARARWQLARINRLSYRSASLVQFFETWAIKSARANPMAFTLTTVSGAKADVVVPPRVRLFLPLCSQPRNDRTPTVDLIISVVSAQRIRTTRGRIAVVEPKFPVTLNAGDQIMYTGIEPRPWRQVPWGHGEGGQR